MLTSLFVIINNWTWVAGRRNSERRNVIATHSVTHGVSRVNGAKQFPRAALIFLVRFFIQGKNEEYKK